MNISPLKHNGNIRVRLHLNLNFIENTNHHRLSIPFNRNLFYSLQLFLPIFKIHQVNRRHFTVAVHKNLLNALNFIIIIYQVSSFFNFH